ncbi:MAG TPA: ATP-binding cassette domain-containing protein [Lacibacter sp.]|nr:ATP-binding cassette domain-containing protein [Lacibacter sp.]HMO89164.1 ATP-binding cassette domain-containing protein [Lacibacter sp.]HMP86545.1 ATP-binding cassette domain-containing protein [Lacibacter sp.]
MAGAYADWNLFTPVHRLFDLLRLERKEVTSIYFYAILSGLFQLAIPLGIQAVINFVLAGTLSTSMVVLISLVVIAVFLSGFLTVNQMKIIEKIQQRIFARYAFEFAWRIPKLDMQKVDGYYMPEFINRFFDSISLQKSISRLLLDIPTATIQVLFGLILLSLYANIFIIFSLLIIIVIYLILYNTSARGLSTSLEESDYKYKVAGWLEEVARVMKSFRFSRLSNLPIEKTDEYVTGYIDARTRHFKVLLVQYWSLIIFKVLITAGMLVVGGILLVQNQINIGQFVAAEIVILLVLGSVEKLIQSLEKVYDVLTSIEKLGKVLDKPVERIGTLPLEESKQGIAVGMQHVDFGYNDAFKVLDDISFDVSSGTKVCIMGTDGSGKSTLLRLFTGSYMVFKGNILVNGVPIGNYEQDSLRSRTGILFHQQDIFQGTIYENISLGDRSVPASEILQLARKVGLENFVVSLKNGFDTEIDPMGKRLSAGVVRKILLLRALISHPRLLLLEEPWLGFDEESQLQIMNYLLYETPEATVLVASNDESFARKCDYVIRMEKGAITVQGKPTEIF